jgi:hypothetical protein
MHFLCQRRVEIMFDKYFSKLPRFSQVHFFQYLILFKFEVIIAIGVNLKKADVDAQAIVVPATIVDHQRHDTAVNEGKVPDYTRESKSKCVIS